VNAVPAYHFHATVWLVMVALAGGYLLLLRHWDITATRRQRLLFLSGVALLWLGADWPLHDLAEERLYSAHMLQHMLFTLVAPPLLLLGTPAALARRLLARPTLFRVVRFVSKPFYALVLFNLVVVITHWPVLVERSVGDEPLHFALHVVVFTTAVLMWMPVLSPMPEIKRLGPPGQMIYLFLQSIVPTIPASFLTLSDGVIYKVYETFPRIWGISAIDDQRLAGVIMKLGGGFVLWGVIAAVFFRWAFREQDADRAARRRGLVRTPSDDEVLTWDEVEAELARTAPPAPAN
jgi:putative membrane protein